MKAFAIPSPTEPRKKLEMYSPAFYASVPRWKPPLRSHSHGRPSSRSRHVQYAAKYKTLIYLAGSTSAEVIADVALCPFEAVKVSSNSARFCQRSV
ncbi:Mitochondrial phosphate carrier protein 2, mitochondrial, partial [Cucurbita argyrosperma subsp. sororia]